MYVPLFGYLMSEILKNKTLVNLVIFRKCLLYVYNFNNLSFKKKIVIFLFALNMYF